MRLDAIGITAKDVKASVAFYQMLGVGFAECENTAEHVEATLPNGLRLMIDSESLMKKLNPNWVEPKGQRMALAFLCKSPGEVDEVFKKLMAAGYKASKEPWDAFWGQRYATVLDPDGNGVDLFAQL